MKFYESCAYLERAFLICCFCGKKNDLKGDNDLIIKFLADYLRADKKKCSEYSRGDSSSI